MICFCSSRHEGLLGRTVMLVLAAAALHAILFWPNTRGFSLHVALQPKRSCTSSKILIARRAATQQDRDDEVVVCSRCKRSLPCVAFSLDRSRKSGLKSECRTCRNARARAYRQRLKQLALTSNLTHPDDARFFCPYCKQMLPAKEFRRSLTAPNGLQGRCRVCVTTSQKLREQNYAAAFGERKPPCMQMPVDNDKLEAALSLEGRVERNDALYELGMAYCPSCRESKSLSDFWRQRNRRLGVQGYCKRCRAQRRGQRRQTSGDIAVVST